MCGLFGIASTGLLSLKEKEFFETLGKLSTSRGKDSTGVFQMKLIKFPTPQEKESGYKFYYNHIKDVCEPTYFFNRKDWKASRNEGNHIYMGHNRHATVGEVTKAAAHPFVIKSTDDRFMLSGMHNGTLADYVDKGGEHHSDSHKLYSRIAEVGLKTALEELKEKSAYALAFVDGTGQPTFFRNSKRTLYFGLTKNKNTVVWASEERFLKAAETMHGIGLDGTSGVATNQLVKLDLFTHEVRFVIAKDYLKKEIIELHEKDYVYNSHWNMNAGRHSPRSYVSHLGYDGFKSEEEAWASQYYNSQINRPSVNLPVVTSINSYGRGIATIKSLTWNHDRGYLVVDKVYTKTPETTTTAYIYKGNADYLPLMRMWEEAEHKKLSIPYLSMNDKDEIIITLNSSKKKDKKKIVGKGHHNYVGWLDLFEQQESLFEDWALSSVADRIPFQDRFDRRLMHYNNLNKEAAELTRIWKDLEKKEKLAKESETTESDKDLESLGNTVEETVEEASKEIKNLPALPNFITQDPSMPKFTGLPPTKVTSTPPWESSDPLDRVKAKTVSVQKEVREAFDEMFRERKGTAWTDGLFYDTGYSYDSIDSANDKLSWGCRSCGNPQVIQDTAYWINSGEFVCLSCYGKDETRQSLPQVKNSKMGKVIRRQ